MLLLLVVVLVSVGVLLLLLMVVSLRQPRRSPPLPFVAIAAATDTAAAATAAAMFTALRPARDSRGLLLLPDASEVSHQPSHGQDVERSQRQEARRGALVVVVVAVVWLLLLVLEVSTAVVFIHQHRSFQLLGFRGCKTNRPPSPVTLLSTGRENEPAKERPSDRPHFVPLERLLPEPVLLRGKCLKGFRGWV